MIAFLTILITTVNFVVSVEVNFYPKYRNYYSLFNDKGAIKDIMQAGNEMREVLNMELKYTAVKQLLTTALAISIGGILLKYLPLGFNDLMEGYFRTLCVGYGIYAIANTMLLLLLYFTHLQRPQHLPGVQPYLPYCHYYFHRCIMDLDFCWEAQCFS